MKFYTKNQKFGIEIKKGSKVYWKPTKVKGVIREFLIDFIHGGDICIIIEWEDGMKQFYYNFDNELKLIKEE